MPDSFNRFQLPSALIQRVLSLAISHVVDTLLGQEAALVEDVEQDEAGNHDDDGQRHRGQHRGQRAGRGRGREATRSGRRRTA